MEKTGFIKFFCEEATTEYTYNWELGKSWNELNRWASKLEQDKIETDQITFDTGILNKTKHSMKVFLIPDQHKLFLSFQMGNPSVYDQFTHSNISLTKVELRKQNFTGQTDRDFTIAAEDFIEKYSLKSQLVDDSMIEKVYDGGHIYAPWDHVTYQIQITLTFKHAYWIDEISSKTKVEEAPLAPMVLLPTIDTKSLYESKQFADFVIFCEDSSFKAHKIVLAARSPAFASMFQQPLSETLEGKMTVTDAEPNSIEQFLKFIYTGTADFETYAAELFLLADKYCVDNLKQLCEHHLIKSVNVENGLDLYKLGKLVNSEKLADKCIKTLKSNIKTVDDATAFARDFPFTSYRVVFD